MTEPKWAPGANLGDEEWEALARYAAGESTAREARAIRDWLEQDPARAALLATLGEHTERLQAEPRVADIDAAWRRVEARLHEPAVITFPTSRERSRFGWRTTALRAAAVVALLFAGAAVWRSMVEQPAPQQVAQAQRFETGVGETDTISLSDGSSVVLAPLSSITVDAGYNQNRRDVALTGVALFEVAHDATRPFRVHAGGAIVEDIGTAFTVDADAGGVQVAVLEGVVKLEPAAATADTGAILSAGDLGVFNPDGSIRSERLSDARANTAWTQHRIVFIGANYNEVARELHRWYGIRLRTSDPAIATKRLTATFAGESAQEVLNILALAYGARIEQRGDTAIVRALGPGEQR